MIEIGAKLREKREENGVSIEEASSDLNIQEDVILNLENGIKSFFNDVIELKELIKTYSKYLGLNEEEMENEFNEFMFEYTSKIPLKDIENAIENINNGQLNKEKVSSPYTKEPQGKMIADKKRVIFFISIILIIIFFSILCILKIESNFVQENVYVLRR